LRNDPPPPIAEPVSLSEIISDAPAFAEMITKMSPEKLMNYLSSLKSQYETSESHPEGTESAE
jgi:hypothetical protein